MEKICNDKPTIKSWAFAPTTGIKMLSSHTILCLPLESWSPVLARDDLLDVRNLVPDGGGVLVENLALVVGEDLVLADPLCKI